MEQESRVYTNPEVPVSHGSYVTGAIGAFWGLLWERCRRFVR